MIREEAFEYARRIRNKTKDASVIVLDGECIDAILSNPWHKTSEKLPKMDIWAMKKNGRYPKILQYHPSADRWFYDEYGYTEEGVREYYDYFMPIPELPKED